MALPLRVGMSMKLDMTFTMCWAVSNTHSSNVTSLVNLYSRPSGEREQINAATAWLDASVIYGLGDNVSTVIRAGETPG
jgi:hypothetical protein